jgi:tetratricopeptide (TPR) repeat protein
MKAAVALALVILAGAAHAEVRVAVLPFKPLVAGNKEWIGAGLAETLTTALAAVPGVRVVERSQLHAVQADASDEAAAKLGRLVSAQRIVLGSFQLFGGEILVNGRFVDTATGVVVAGRTFRVRGRVDKLFDLYPQLTANIMDSLGIRASGKAVEALAAAHATSSSLPAHELYVKGRDHFHLRTLAGYRKAVELLQLAVQQDPGYAHAFAALAEAQAEVGALECRPLQAIGNTRKATDCYSDYEDEPFLVRLGYADKQAARAAAEQRIAELSRACAAWPKVALANATTAASFTPALPAAHRALARVAFAMGDTLKAEVEARTLLNLNPGDAVGTHLLGLCAPEPADREAAFRRSLAADPQLAENHFGLARLAFDGQKLAEALQHLERGLQLAPHDLPARELQAEVLVRLARPKDALAPLEEVLATLPEHPRARFVLAMARWMAGGPHRPWAASEARKDASVTDWARAKLWDRDLCDPTGLGELDRKTFVKTAKLVSWHRNEHRDDRSTFCAGKTPGRIYLVEHDTLRESLSLKAQGGDLFRRMLPVDARICTAEDVAPDAEVRVELRLDGQPLSAFVPVGPDLRQTSVRFDEKVPLARTGAPARTTRPVRELRVHTRLMLPGLRAVLADGKPHQLVFTATRDGRRLAEGGGPIQVQLDE